MSLLSGVERAPQAHVVWKTGGKRRNPVHWHNSERSLGDTETGADQPEDPEDWGDTASAVHGVAMRVECLWFRSSENCIAPTGLAHIDRIVDAAVAI